MCKGLFQLARFLAKIDNILLKGAVLDLAVQVPAEEVVGHVHDKVLADDAKTLAVIGHLSSNACQIGIAAKLATRPHLQPVAHNIGQVLRHVVEASIELQGIQARVHDRLIKQKR